MQISNNPLTFYPPVPAENRNSSRVPVTFDNTSYTPVPVSPQTPSPRSVEPVSSANDQQQVRFIRNFFSTDVSTDGESKQSALSPRAVQQYLYVDSLPQQPIQQQGRLLDEMV